MNEQTKDSLEQLEALAKRLEKDNVTPEDAIKALDAMPPEAKMGVMRSAMATMAFMLMDMQARMVASGIETSEGLTETKYRIPVLKGRAADGVSVFQVACGSGNLIGLSDQVLLAYQAVRQMEWTQQIEGDAK